MNFNFKALSISHKNSPIEIREELALDEKSCSQLLNKLHEISGIAEALVISTCNRTEIYYSSDSDSFDELISLICIQKGLSNTQKYKPFFENITHHEEAVKRLFEVSIGLESQVVGDFQIAGQIKQAYQLSADTGMAGPFLHRLMHSIFFTSKKVVQETSFRDGAASVSYAVVEMIEEIVAERYTSEILVIGVGEIGADVVRNLKNTKLSNIVIANRTHEKAISLAEECGYKAIPFDDIFNAMKKADVIICSVVKDSPFITNAIVEDLQINSFKYFFDLSVPRSVDSNVEDIPGALVYNIDSIHNRANEALQKRIAAIPAVKNIINESLEQFNEWSRDMIVSPVINKLKNALEQIRLEEISRYTRQLAPEEMEKVDKITKSIMQKIIKLPVLQLKAACKRGEAETLVDVLNDIFNLEQQTVIKK